MGRGRRDVCEIGCRHDMDLEMGALHCSILGTRSSACQNRDCAHVARKLILSGNMRVQLDGVS
eukprot:364696-Chlamydomonas_euryale.AAC.12